MITDTAAGEIIEDSSAPAVSAEARSRLLVLLVGLERLSAPFTEGLAALDGEVEAHSVDANAEALDAARRASPDLVLVSPTLDGDAFGLIYDLRTILPKALILFLTPSSRPEPALRALSSGADDVVTPPHSVTNVMLRARIAQGNGDRRAVHETAGDTTDPSRITLHRMSRTLVVGDRELRLTGREFELLDRLLGARGAVVTRSTILVDIWGPGQHNEAVLDATVHRLRRKLEQDPARPRILATVRGKGYRLEAQHVRVTDR